MDNTHPTLDTQLIHAGELHDPISGAVILPIFQSSTFRYGGESSYHDIHYIRLNNTPNHEVLHAKMSALEGAEASLVTSSGMAAITGTLLALLRSGDHLLVQNKLYGGTHSFVVDDLPKYGITYDFIDARAPETWVTKLKPNTRALYVESMSNPLLELIDLKAASTFARANNLVSVVDNTFLSPVNLRPAEWGFDLIVHSATKYLNGHSDIVAGAVSGKKHLVKKITHLVNHLGSCLDPHAAFLLHRGLKTLALRVRQQNLNASRLAQFLENHPKIDRVHYPALKTHPQHSLTEQFINGGCGGVLSFHVKGDVAHADRLISRVKLPVSAPSLGGVETLITRPATTSHAGLSPEHRREFGVTDSLIRVAIGIEGTDDLINDFDQALAGI